MRFLTINSAGARDPAQIWAAWDCLIALQRRKLCDSPIRCTP